MFEDPTFWVAVAFILFLAILVWKKVPGVITKALDERALRISGELEEARRLREEAQALLAEYQRKQRDAEREAEAIIDQAREDASLYAAEARKKFAETLERRWAMAESKIAQAEAQAVKEVRARAADIAVAAAARLIAEGLPEDKAKGLVDDGIKALADRFN